MTAASAFPQHPLDRIRKADEAASVVHDFLWGKNGVTKKQANEAIWTIHTMLRSFGEQGGDLG